MPERRIETERVLEATGRLVILALIFQTQTATVREECLQRLRRPLLDRYPLCRRENHAETVEQLEHERLLDGEELLQRVFARRAAGQRRRLRVHDGCVDAQARRVLHDLTVHNATGLNDLAGPHARRRIRLRRLLQRDLVENRLDAPALDDGEHVRAAQVRRDQLRESALQRDKRAVRADEP